MISQRMKLYFLSAIVSAIAIALIGYVYTTKDLPPYPGTIESMHGKPWSGKKAIMEGQQIWQRYGLMDLGSVWGHGTYRGPDFTAQALHNMGVTMRAVMARKRFKREYSALLTEEKGAVDAVVIQQIKTNLYDKESDTLQLTSLQVAAFIKNRAFYKRLFTEGDENGPINPDTITDPTQLQNLADFFFWTAWCAGTIRHGDTHTYTNNWPHDPSVGNRVSGKALVWSAISLVAFGLGLGVFIFLYHKHGFNKGSLPYKPEPAQALAQAPVSSSQRKSAKFFLVVAALFFLQVNVGGLMAHYTVSPDAFYGLKSITKFIPYNWVKTWHLQLAVFWIAVSWIGMTLFVAPFVGNREPKGQGLLVDLLFFAVVVVAVGSLVGEVLGIKGYLGDVWFWLGHQGWEYLELGRMWQILLFIGLILWLFLVVRALKDHFKAGRDKWGLPNFLAYSGVAVVGFFSFGLTYDPQTHITIADFWRWWVVHTWVEGAFEFFAAAAVVFVMVNLGLVRLEDGMRTVYFTVGLALFAGIIGVGHHYYWFGEPSLWLALGSTVSALEPVPILLLIAEVWHGQKALVKAGSSFPYKYPLMFLMAAICWEFIGGAVMGLSITTPVVNYYEHSTYLTVNHGHTALFGTYGILGVGLSLFSMRGLVEEKGWSPNLLKVCFWSLNIGLFVMFTATLLPVGILQVLDNINHGFWHARSNAFWSRDIIQVIGNTRMVPDFMIIIGSGAFLLFMLKAMKNLKKVTIKAGESFS
ncbi:cbb3-type cytochrome c oxidase subunit I [Desulfoluna sp.]|uniref:nitric-oxide reductase large subunit n=1 Tax=Desulfoluna sp. TaxID=2045199 RepID=UPI00262A26F5|nr:cbb3-type cytochrome c oxidase subunit I [Desulfoluna sp.]